MDFLAKMENESMRTLQSIVAELFPISIPSVAGVEPIVNISLKNLLSGFNAAQSVVKAIESLSFQIVLTEGVLFTKEQIVCCNDNAKHDGAELQLIVGSTSDYREILIAPDSGALTVAQDDLRKVNARLNSPSVNDKWSIDKEKTSLAFSMGGYAIPLLFLLNHDLRTMMEVCCSDEQLYSSANACFLNWLNARNIPQKVLHLFSWFMPMAEIAVGSGVINDYQTIMTINDTWPEAFESGFFIIGNCPNGDHIAIRTLKHGLETGFLSHEEIDHDNQMDSHYIPIAKTFSAFFHDANMFGYFPVDYWQAKELAYHMLG